MGRLILFVGSIVLTTIFYRPVLNLSFTQDDWFLLRQAKFNSPREQVFSSLPNPDSIYFRPLGMQGYFYLLYRLFGLHEWMYRLVTIAIHSLNVVLVFSLTSLLFSSAFLSISISTLYLLSPLHFASLGWLANISFVTGASLTLLTLLAGVQGKRTIAIVFFIIGLLVNELVVTTPFLLLLVIARSLRPARNASHPPAKDWHCRAGSKAGGRGNPEQRDVPRSGEGSHPHDGSRMRSFTTAQDDAGVRLPRSLRSLAMTSETNSFLIMMLISFSYLLFRLFSSRAGTDAYALTFDPRLVAQNIRWLFLWSLGWPETIRDHFISLFSMRREFVQTFPLETAIFAITTLVSVGLMVKEAFRKPLLIIGFVWFLVAISPVVFFRSHVFPHYAMIGSIGLYVLIISGLRYFSPRIKFLFLTLWLIQSFLAFRVNRITHWWIQHAQLSQELIDQARMKYPTTLSDKTLVLSAQNPQQADIVLAGDSAMQVLYNDPAMKTVFVKTPE